MRSSSARTARLLASAALLSILALGVAGCSTTGRNETTGSIAPAGPGLAGPEEQWRQQAQIWGERYRSDPDNADAAIRYAQALRATTQRAQAVAVLEQASIRNPKNKALLGAYGRALADVGNFNQALDVLSRAHTPEQPDWHILSAQGAVLDQMGRHAEAQRHYSAALKIAPNDPSVLSNLGLSYALSKDLKRAETTLRQAVAQPRVDPKARQNLALVIGLQGRVAEAEEVARAGLTADEAAASVADLRQVLAEQEAQKMPAPKKLTRPAKPLHPLAADAGS
jgi:Flp pilus assembly protein TadD